MIRNTKSIFTSLLFLTVTYPAFAQAQDRDPFSSSEVSTAGPEPRKEKVVVDIKTLDLVLDWLDENIAIAVAIDRSVELKHKIEAMQNSSVPDLNTINRSKEQLNELRTSIRERDGVLNRIPIDNTFDLVRWHQFKEELRVRRTEFRVQRAEMRHQIDSLKRENEALRTEIERLNNNK